MQSFNRQMSIITDRNVEIRKAGLKTKLYVTEQSNK